MNIKAKKLALSALFICADVLLTRLLAINTPLMKIGFGFAAVALCALMYGPLWAALTAALGDLVGSLLFPVGAFFPGFTLTAALTGLIFGLCLYRKKPGLKTSFFAAALNCVFVTLLANTAMIAFISGAAFKALLLTRLVQLAVMLPVQWVTLWALSSSRPIIRMIEQERD